MPGAGLTVMSAGLVRPDTQQGERGRRVFVIMLSLVTMLTQRADSPLASEEAIIRPSWTQERTRMSKKGLDLSPAKVFEKC